MALGECDRGLGELRGSFVLIRIEVTPDRERDAVDRVAAERRRDTLERVHRAAKVVSVM